MISTSVLLLALAAWGGTGTAWTSAESKILAAGEWSTPVADARGYAVRGRLVLCTKQVNPDRREVAVYVELQGAHDFIGNDLRLFCDLGRTDFRPEYKGGLHCTMRDKDGQEIPATGYPFSGAMPRSQWLTLPVAATLRLRASPFGIHRPGALAISPQANQLWVINANDPRAYFLSGTFTVDPAQDPSPIGNEHVWRGTLILPPARIVNRPQ